jgi:hypothetical protein
VNFLKPFTITDAMIGAGTSIAEPASGEIAWVSAGTFAVGAKRIRTATHREYLCIQAHSGRTNTPETDTAYWQDVGPTRRWAPFDIYTSTSATATTSLTYVLSPGYFNALALYGLVGTAYAITIKDAPGGATIFSETGPLSDPPAGWYEYLFAAPKAITKLFRPDLPIRPNAELTITITAGTGQPVGVGMIVVGNLVDLVGDLADFGGTEYGSSAEPVTYSYIKTDDFGNTTIVRRHKATSMTAKVVLPRANADEALRQIEEVLDVPVAWIATAKPGYSGLNVFGLGSARLAYQSAVVAEIDLTVKGMI